MANSDAPRGLKPVMHRDGSPWNGATNIYYIPASDGTAAYVGGLVKMAGSADARGIPTVTGNVATGDAVIGVITGVKWVTRDSLTYRAASTARYVEVVDGRDVLFEIQEDSVGGALAATSVGNTADLIGFTAGSTATGLSTMEIDSSTATASGDGTEDVVVLRLVDREDNEIGANAKWLVRLNNLQLVDGFAGV